jgi:predicted ester cyclase
MKKSIFVLLLPAFYLFGCSSNEPKKEEAAAPAAATSTASAADMKEAKEEKNKQVALASVNAMSAGNVDGVLKDAATDIIDYGDGSGPSMKGTDTARKMISQWMNSVENYKGEDLMALADGDHVAVFGTWSGRFKADFMGMKTKGKSFKVRDVDVFTFNSDGKITEHRNVQSFETMLNQLSKKK